MTGRSIGRARCIFVDAMVDAHVVKGRFGKRLGSACVLVASTLGFVAACTSSSDPGGANEEANEATHPRDASTTDARPQERDATASDAAATSDPDAATSDPDAATSDPDAAAEGDADSGAAAQCHDLALRGDSVPLLDIPSSVSSSDDFTGGTLVDGTYVLTQATRYRDTPGVGDPKTYASETLRIRGNVIEDVTLLPNGDLNRFTATLTVSAATLRMTTSCVWASNPNDLYLALGDWKPLEYQLGAFDATSTTATFWSPLGNHASLVRVFAKVE